ncbi:hypothetical protein [Kiloniella laminariae]|uniref:hypothetical protein n=1 Tax=Kiloniella laminariae TaxID=454162 RepID=UPI0003739937|nr:hypothetical protein [Kiloniella laminariae]
MAVVFRLLGWLFLAIAVVSVAFDIFIFVEQGSFHFSLLGENWYAVHPSSQPLVQSAIERHVSEVLWQYVLFPITLLPTVVIGTILGGLFTILSSIYQPRRRR